MKVQTLLSGRSFSVISILYQARGRTGSPRLYLVAAEKEESQGSGTGRMHDTLVSMGFTAEEVKILIDPDGEHSEWFWAGEFEDAFTWMFNPGK